MDTTRKPTKRKDKIMSEVFQPQNQDVSRFLENPSETTFQKISQNGPFLLQVLGENQELAIKYFEFSDWLTLKINCLFTKDEKAEQIINEQLKASIKSFKDAYRYYFTLCPTAQDLYVKELIGSAETEQDLKKLTFTLGESYKDMIEERRKEIANNHIGMVLVYYV